MTPESIPHFWFEELKAPQHFAGMPGNGFAAARRFGATLQAPRRASFVRLAPKRSGAPGGDRGAGPGSPATYTATRRAPAGRHGAGAGAGAVASGQAGALPPAQRLCLHALHTCTANPAWQARSLCAFRRAGLEGNLAVRAAAPGPSSKGLSAATRTGKRHPGASPAARSWRSCASPAPRS